MASKVAPADTSGLTANELRQFESDVANLGYDDTLEALDLLEHPEGEPLVLLSGKTQEHWEEPAKILCRRLLQIAPRHTSRWIQREEMGWRGSVAFIDQFPKEMPALAWDETKKHYATYWKRTNGGEDYPVPALANGIFFGLEYLEGQPGRRFLLDDSYTDRPFAAKLQQDALAGMLRAADSTGALISFLEWRLGPGKGLSGELSSHSFSVDTGPDMKVTEIGIALLAQRDPPVAIAWVKKNQELLDETSWGYAVFAGWASFSPETPEDLARYKTQRRDAMEWLIEEGMPTDAMIHNAYVHWRFDYGDGAKEWLKAPSNSKEVKAAKDVLIPLEKRLQSPSD